VNSGFLFLFLPASLASADMFILQGGFRTNIGLLRERPDGIEVLSDIQLHFVAVGISS